MLYSCFIIKYKTKSKHQLNLVNLTKCPENTCTENYIGETAKKTTERISDHSCRDKCYQIFLTC